MADLEGTILLTGANGGFGSAIASYIASSVELGTRYHGLYTVRDTATSHNLDAALAVLPRPPHGTHPHEKTSLDLSRLGNVREVAAAINARVAAGSLPPIRALILNAGLEEFETQTWTQEGLDMTFATNYLGHWLLTVLLLQSIDRHHGRVVWISSWAHKSVPQTVPQTVPPSFRPVLGADSFFVQPSPHDRCNSVNGAFRDGRYTSIFKTDDIEAIAKGWWSPTEGDKTGWAAGYRRYGASKLCGVTTISELQRRLDRDTLLHNVSVLGIDPGLVNTGIVRRSGNWFLRVFLMQLVLPVLAPVMVYFKPDGPVRTAKRSAQDIVAAALENDPPPLTERPKGLYLNGSQLGARNPEAEDINNGAMLWRETLKYTHLREGETSLQDWQ